MIQINNQYEFFKNAKFDDNGSLIVTVTDGSFTSSIQYFASDYSNLLVVGSGATAGELAYVVAEQGTKWLPGSLGGTYYSSGLWYYNGTAWVNDNISINKALNDAASFTDTYVTGATIDGSNVLTLKKNNYADVTVDLTQLDTPIDIKDALGQTANGPFFLPTADNPFATQRQIDNMRDGGVFGKQGSPISVGGLSITLGNFFSAAIYVDNVENNVFSGPSVFGSILTFSTVGPSYSISLSSFEKTFGWLFITYDKVANELKLWNSDGSVVYATITPPNQLQSITNITNNFSRGYIRKAYFWNNNLLDANSFQKIYVDNGVGNKNVFISSLAPTSRFEPYSVAYNGSSNIWYDTSGNGNDAVILGLMVDPKPWVSFTNLASILPNYLELSGGIMTGNLTVGDNILTANNIVGENMVIQYDNLYLTTSATTFVFPTLDGGNRHVMMTDGAGTLGFSALTKSDVGLSNVDNTSDINKPISTATQNALDGKVNNPLFALGNTTNNTLTTLFSTAIPLNTQKSIRYHLRGRSATTGNRFEAECWFAVDNTGGVTTVIGTLSIDRKSSFTNAVQTSVTITGGNIANINITGPNGQTVVWELYIREIL